MARVVNRFTKLREEGVTVKKPRPRKKPKKQRKRKTTERLPARCRDCNQVHHTTRYDLFCKAAPPRCPACGGILDAPKNVAPKHTGIVKPNPKTSRSTGRPT